MKTRTILAASILACGFLAASTSDVFAHCEIPCGIYTDEMRLAMIEEDCRTIEKSMAKILELSSADEGDANQLTRWVMNKEDHANKIQHVVTQYFMTQRIKPGADSYEEKIALLHQMLIASMKCKQTTDVEHVVNLRNLLGRFGNLYLGMESKIPAKAAHSHPHAGHHP